MNNDVRKDKNKDYDEDTELNLSVMSPKTQKRYLSRVYGIQNSVEKHMQGYARHHDTFKGYNLNLNQHLEEN